MRIHTPREHIKFTQSPAFGIYLILLLVALVTYWPLSLGIFSAKNDNIIAVLPFRYNISEAIRSGNLPLWSPYIYLGFPLHGDMQSGCWNPIVWLFSVFTTYDLTVLHLEILLYIFLAGAGMYRFLGAFPVLQRVRLFGAIAYMLSGFITDSGGSNILFLAGAAFIPFTLDAYLRYLRSPRLSRALKTALAFTLLFLTSYPALTILTAYVMLAGGIYGGLVLRRRTAERNFWKHFFLGHGVMILAFLALAAPAVFSYFELLPFYRRGSSISHAETIQNSFHPACSLSFLFPTAAIKNPLSLSTDLISRNAYFGSFFLLPLFTGAWRSRKTYSVFLGAGVIYFFLFSLGPYTPVQRWSYNLLPLFNTFRHPSNGRLFVILGSLVLSCVLFTELHRRHALKRLRLPAFFFLILVSAYTLYAAIRSSSLPRDSFSGNSGFRMTIKSFLDQLNFFDAVLINGLLQVILLIFFLNLLKKREFFQSKTIGTVFILNSFLLAQAAIPYTLTSKTDPSVINKKIHGFPKGYPLPDLTRSLSDNAKGSLDDYEAIGIASFYNKKIGMPAEVVTPTFIKHLADFFTDTAFASSFLQHPLAYIADTSIHQINSARSGWSVFPKTENRDAQIEITQFTNRSFIININSSRKHYLCLQQVWLPGWEASVDGLYTDVFRANKAFLAVPVPPGRHEVKILYEPDGIKATLILSMAALVSIFILLLTDFRKRRLSV